MFFAKHPERSEWDVCSVVDNKLAHEISDSPVPLDILLELHIIRTNILIIRFVIPIEQEEILFMNTLIRQNASHSLIPIMVNDGRFSMCSQQFEPQFEPQSNLAPRLL